MAKAGARTGVGVSVLDHMADVLYAMGAAPGTDLTGEAFLQQLRHRVHISIPDKGGFLWIGIVVPKQIQAVGPVFSKALFQFRGHGAGKRQILIRAQQIVIIIQMSVAQFRLIREKAGDGLAEIIGIMLPMGLIYRVDQQAAGRRIQHIDIFPMDTAVAAQAHHPDRPIAVRFLPVQRFFPRIRDAYGFARFAYGGYGQHLVVVKMRRVLEEQRHHILLHHVGIGIARRDHPLQGDVHLLCRAIQSDGRRADALAVELHRRAFDRAVGIARGEVAVIQDPDLHTALAGLVQDHIHIRPPFFSAEIRMRAAFHTNGAAVSAVDCFHVFPQRFFILAMLPEKRQDMILPLSLQQLLDGFVHHIPLLCFYFLIWFKAWFSLWTISGVASLPSCLMESSTLILSIIASTSGGNCTLRATSP